MVLGQSGNVLTNRAQSILCPFFYIKKELLQQDVVRHDARVAPFSDSLVREGLPYQRNILIMFKKKFDNNGIKFFA